MPSPLFPSPRPGRTAPLLLAAGLLGCSDAPPGAGGRDAAAGGEPAARTSAAPAPRIRAEVPEVDFGRLFRGETRTAEFPIRNEGDAPLVVQMIQTVCGCTVARLVLPDGTEFVPPKNAVPDPSGIVTLDPGRSMGLFVELATGDQKPGPLSKHVSVHTNDPLNGMLRLGLRATIVAPFHLDPSEVTFEEVRRGEAPSRTVEISAAALEDAAVVGVGELPPWLDASVRRLPGDGRFALDVRLREDAPVGYLKGEVRALVDHPSFDGFDVPVFATVKSRLRFDTGNPANREVIDLGVLPRGGATTAHVEVSLEDGGTPFRLTGVEVDSERADLLETDVETVREGLHYRVSLTCTAGGDVRFVRGTLRIRTDHADQPVKALPFQGWVDSNP